MVRGQKKIIKSLKMLFFSSTGVNIRSRVRTFLNNYKLFGLMSFCCWFSSQPFTKFPQCNRFLIRSKILSRIFSHLTSFISRLSNELPWRDILETSNTFICIFLCYNSTFISFQFLPHSFPPQQQSKSYFSLPPPPYFIHFWFCGTICSYSSFGFN